MKAEFDIQIPAPAKLLTVNAERRLHWSKRAEIVRLWREASCAIAKLTHAPHCECVNVIVTIEQHRGTLADHHAHTPVVKACIDGLVDAGVIDDDDQSRCIVDVFPPERGTRDCVNLHVLGWSLPTPRASVADMEGVRFVKTPRSPEQMQQDLAAERARKIEREQKNCLHAKRVMGVCIGCGHGASR